jgi:hypothetical protein
VNLGTRIRLAGPEFREWGGQVSEITLFTITVFYSLLIISPDDKVTMGLEQRF